MKKIKNEHLFNEIKKLLNEGKIKKEIVKILNLSKSTLARICEKYNLKLLDKNPIIEINCNFCNNKIIKRKNDLKKYCDRKCAALVNNKLRITSDITRSKISQALIKRNIHKPKKIKICIEPRIFYINKINPNKKCNKCGNIGSVLYFGSVCKDCKINIRIFYREACKFMFSVYKYPEIFNLNLLQEKGWYKAKNRGDNKDGMSRDHLYSINDGFINKIDPEILKHPANCDLILHSLNKQKGRKSSITLEELLKRIDEFNIKYNVSVAE